MQEAFPLFAALGIGAALAEREQPGEPAPGRRDPRARPAARCRRPGRAGSRHRRIEQPVVLLDLLRGQSARTTPATELRSVMPSAGIPISAAVANSSSASRCAAQETEMRGDLQLAVAHPNTPWRIPAEVAGRGALAVAAAEQPEAVRRPRPRRGNNRAPRARSALPLPPFAVRYVRGRRRERRCACARAR